METDKTNLDTVYADLLRRSEVSDERFAHYLRQSGIAAKHFFHLARLAPLLDVSARRRIRVGVCTRPIRPPTTPQFFPKPGMLRM